MCVPKVSEIIRGRINSPKASLFETAQAESIDRKKNSHTSHKPALKLGSAAGTPPRAKSRVSLRATITSEIICGRKKPLSAAFFETAQAESTVRTQISHSSPNPALKLGSAFSRTVRGAGRRGSKHYAQELQSRTNEKRYMAQ